MGNAVNVLTFFSPDDDTQSIFLDFIKNTKSQLRIAIFSLHLPPLVETLISLHQAGIDVALVCDSSQAIGVYEKPEIQQLRDAGISLVTGTSEKHKIMHHKFAVRDQAAVLSGSWNFSLSASLEDNYFDIIESTERANLFLSKWQEMWNFISQNEANGQLHPMFGTQMADYPMEHHTLALSLRGPVVHVRAVIKEVDPNRPDPHLPGVFHHHFLIHQIEVIHVEGAKNLMLADEIFCAIRFGDSEGLNKPIEGLSAGEPIELQGEYLDKNIHPSLDNKGNLPVLHFTHHPVGYVIYQGNKYE